MYIDVTMNARRFGYVRLARLWQENVCCSIMEYCVVLIHQLEFLDNHVFRIGDTYLHDM